MKLDPDLSTRGIAEALLGATGEALMTGDFDLMAQCFWLPQALSTSEGLRIVSTAAEFEDMFHRLREVYQSMGVTHLIRKIVDADRRSATRIDCTHVSRLMNGTNQLSPAYPVFAIVSYKQGEWRIAASDYGVEKDGPQELAMMGLEAQETSFEARFSPRDTSSTTGEHHD